jgi:hypothetical protein
MKGVSPDLFRHVRGRFAAILLTALALVPVVFVALTVAGSTRNIVYWDEFDTALDLLLALDTASICRVSSSGSSRSTMSTG